jgi:hypothetical protein
VGARYTPASAAVAFAVQWAHDEVGDLEPQFAYVDGQREQIRFALDAALRAGRFIAEYEIERNDRAGAGVAADRNRYALRYRRFLNHAWTGELLYEYRNSEYARLTPAREERRQQLGFEVARSFPSNWQLVAQYRYSDNDSTDTTYTYDRHRLAAGVSKSF